MAANKREGATLAKEMGLVDGVAFVVGAIIGSGIFISPGVVFAHSGSAGMSIICWLLGMLMAIGGALCYIEVGLLFPKTGGEYVYLYEAYSFKKKNTALDFMGSLFAFLYTWASGLIRPAGAAVITLTSAKYLSKPFFVDSDVPSFQLKALSLILICKCPHTLVTVPLLLLTCRYNHSCSVPQHEGYSQITNVPFNCKDLLVFFHHLDWYLEHH